MNGAGGVEPFNAPRPVTPGGTAQAGRSMQPANPASTEASFRSLLRERIQTLQWSKHAEQRLRGSARTLDAHDQARISEAVERLAEQNVRNGLVLYHDLALVVSVEHRKVITLATPERWRSDAGVFTGIDGAVIMQAENDREAHRFRAGPPAADALQPTQAGAQGSRNDGSDPILGRLMQR